MSRLDERLDEIDDVLAQAREYLGRFEVPVEEREQAILEGRVGELPGDVPLKRVEEFETAGRKKFDRLKTGRTALLEDIGDLPTKPYEPSVTEEYLKPAAKAIGKTFLDIASPPMESAKQVGRMLRPQPVPAPHEAINAVSEPAGVEAVSIGRTPEGRTIYQRQGEEAFSERSLTVIDPRINQGRPTNIPSVFGGKELTREDAISRIVEAGGMDPETGLAVPSFDTYEGAISGARQRSDALGVAMQPRLPSESSGLAIPTPVEAAAIKPPPRDLSIGESLREVTNNYMQGVAQIPADALKSIAIASKTLDDYVPEAMKDPRTAEEKLTYRLGTEIDKLAKRLFPTDPERQQDFVIAVLPRAVGSMTGFLATGLVGAVANAPVVTTMIAGAAVGGAEQYEDAKGYNADDPTAKKAFWLGAAVGTSEALPIGALLNRFNKATGGRFLSILKESGVTAAQEFLQEWGQQVGSNVIAQQLYDEHRGLFDGAGISGAAGGVSGAIVGFLSGVLQGRRGRHQINREERAASASQDTPLFVEPKPSVRQRIEGEANRFAGILPEAFPVAPQPAPPFLVKQPQMAPEAPIVQPPGAISPSATLPTPEPVLPQPAPILAPPQTPTMALPTPEDVARAKAEALGDEKTGGAPKGAIKPTIEEQVARMVEEAAQPGVVPREEQPQPATPTPTEAISPRLTERAQKVYQGRGASPEEVYGKEAVEAGRAVPIFGPADYYATTAKDAAHYGEVTEHQAPDLKNPFILDSDKKWFDLLRKAKTPHLDNMNEFFYREPERIPEATKRLQQYLRDQGYDGIIVTLDPASDKTRRLGDMVDHDQIVAFKTEKKPVTPQLPPPVPVVSKQPTTPSPAEAVTVDEKAKEAATSPANALPEPTEAQKEAGNYKKAHVTIAGLDISIENPVGSTRSGTDASGKPWSITMKSHYGYIRGTKGKDKEHIDLFIKPGTPDNYAGPVYVVDQVKPESGAFDEHKIVMGAASIEEARRLYQENYAKDWKGMGNITHMPMPEFKQWLAEGNTSKPAAGASSQKPAEILSPTEALRRQGQQSIPVPPPEIGQRPIIGRAPAPGEAPLFSPSAQVPDPEQIPLAQPLSEERAAIELPRHELSPEQSERLRQLADVGMGLVAQGAPGKRGSQDIQNAPGKEDTSYGSSYPAFMGEAGAGLTKKRALAALAKIIKGKGHDVGKDVERMKEAIVADPDLNQLVNEGWAAPEGQESALPPGMTDFGIFKPKPKAKPKGLAKPATEDYAETHEETPSRQPASTDRPGEPARTAQEFPRVEPGYAAVGWDQATRIKGSRGSPATLYHGGQVARTTIDFSKLGEATEHPSSGLGAFFSFSQQDAGQYGPVVSTFHLDLRHPKLIKVEDLPGFDTLEEAVVYRRALQAQGYDGIYLRAGHLSGHDQVIAFLPEQIIAKEQAGEEGDTVAEPRPSYGASAVPLSPIWYSKLERTIQDRMPEKASAGQVMATLANAGVKAEELKWVDVEGFLASKERVSRTDLLEYVRANNVQIQDVINGETDFREKYEIKRAPGPIEAWFISDRGTGRTIASGFKSREEAETDFINSVRFAEGVPTATTELSSTKFSSHTLPGGKDYRELLLTLPARIPSRSAYDSFAASMKKKYGENYYRKMSEQEHRDYERLEKSVSDEMRAMPPTFTRGHWSEPNVLAHVRFNTRTDAEGRRVLFLEEIRSDWHQKGKREGYSPGGPSVVDGINGQIVKVFPSVEDAHSFVSMNRAEHPSWYVQHSSSMVPDAPFKKTWHELVLRRMLRYAAEHGYDKLAWTTGEQQADRYDLSKQVDSVEITKAKDGSFLVGIFKDGKLELNRDVKTAPELAEFIGKDLADKAAQQPVGTKKYTGLDLKVGGEGMKGFYDQIIPAYLNKYAKKWGAKVGTVKIGISSSMGQNERLEYSGNIDINLLNEIARSHEHPVTIKQQAKATYGAIEQGLSFTDAFAHNGSPALADALGGHAKWVPLQSSTTVHALDITPAMRQSVLTESQALFENRATYEVRKGENQAQAHRLAQEALGDLDRNAGQVSAVRGALGRLQRFAGAGIKTVGLGFVPDLIRTGRVDLRGQRIRSNADLARLAQVYRDPRFETLRIIYVNKSGKIVAHEGISSRMPSSSAAFLPFGKDVKKAYEQVVRERQTQPDDLGAIIHARQFEPMRRRMQRVGATGYYLLHNHPSGAAKASWQDLALTKNFSRNLRGFKGHVIIDSEQYGHIDRTFKDTVYGLSQGLTDKLLKPSIPHDILGRSIHGPTDAASVGLALKVPDRYVTLAMLDGSHRVRAIQEIPVGLWTRTAEIRKYLRGRQAEFGSEVAVSFYGGQDPDVSAHAKTLIKDGHLLDHVNGTNEGIPRPVSSIDMISESAKARLEEPLRRAVRVEEPRPGYGEGQPPRRRKEMDDAKTYRAERAKQDLDEITAELETQAGRHGQPDERGAVGQLKPKATIDNSGPDVAFGNQTIEDRYQAAKKGVGPSTSGPIAHVRETLSVIAHGLSREYIDLPNIPRYAGVHEALRQLQAAPSAAKEQTVRLLDGLVATMGPKPFDLFTRKVILDDLQYEAEREHALPFGLTPESLTQERARVDAAVQDQPTVQEAVRQRQALMDAVRERLVDAGILKPEANNPAYFHHQVLEYALLRAQGQPTRLKTPKPGYAKRREGSVQDINANYLEAEFEFLHRALIDLKTVETLKKIEADPVNIRPQLEQQAAKVRTDNPGSKTTWRDLVPDGYTLWQPDKGNLFFTAQSVSERAIADLTDALLDPALFKGDVQSVTAALEMFQDKIRPLLAVGGKKRQLVLPDELATTLEKLRPSADESLWGQVFTKPVALWKQWVLINPRRWAKYNLNNLSGDLDGVIASNPKLLAEVPRATYELWAIRRGQMPPTTAYKDAVERGVFDSGLTIQEIPEINLRDEFRHLGKGDVASPKKAAQVIWRILKDSTQFRENILRYAGYRWYVDRLSKGEAVPYGASRPEIIDALTDPKDKAAKLAREQVIDYGAISAFGKDIRKRMIPFFSWLEGNAVRYIRLVDNAFSQGVGKGLKTGAVLAGLKGARKTAYLMARMAVLYAIVQAFNHLFFPDEEDELSTLERQRLHVNLGRDAEGKIQVLRFQGALSDVLEWIGFQELAPMLREVEAGRATPMDVLKQMAKSPLNKLVQGITPVLKMPAELLSGRSYFPDVLNSRPIDDRWRHLLRLFSLENEYDLATGRPTRGYSASLKEAVVTTRDPGQIAYYDIRALKERWLERQGYERGYGQSPNSQLLRDWKMALRMQDQDALARLRPQIEALPKQSYRAAMRSLEPLAGLSKVRQAAFLKTLNPKERQKLAKAEAFYRALFTQSDLPAKLKPKPSTPRRFSRAIPTPEEAAR